MLDTCAMMKKMEEENLQLESVKGNLTDEKEKKEIQIKIDVNEHLLKGLLLEQGRQNTHKVVDDSSSKSNDTETRASIKRSSQNNPSTPLKKNKALGNDNSDKADVERDSNIEEMYDNADLNEKADEGNEINDVEHGEPHNEIRMVGNHVEITQSPNNRKDNLDGWIEVGPNGSPKSKKESDTKKKGSQTKNGSTYQAAIIKAKRKVIAKVPKAGATPRQKPAEESLQRKLDYGISNNAKTNQKTDKKTNDINKTSNPVYQVNVKEREKNQATLSFASAVNSGSSAMQDFTIRVRISWNGQQKGVGPLEMGMEIKRILKTIALDLKEVDKDASILPWNGTDDGSPIFQSGNIEELNPLSAAKYVDVPWYTKIFLTNKIHHQNGIRITTRYNLRQFVDSWNKRSKEVKKTRMFISVKPAQMQGSAGYELVGLLQGSVGNKDIKMINDELREITGIEEIEASWQTISQAGGADTKKLWDRANQIALKKCTKNTSQYERLKQQAAPTGLQVYVGEKSMVSEVRVKLYEAFGKEIDGKWPEFKDGSRMKFLPLSNKKIKNIAQIEKRIDWHIYQKATDETLFLEPMDIWTPIPGAEDTTIGQYLHNMKNEAGKPIFRHIIHKWTANALDTAWEITARPEMVDEAVLILKGLKSQLATTYGNDILNLFPTKQIGLNASASFNKTYSRYNNEDAELEKMIQDAGGTEDILDPGFKLFFMADIVADDSQNDESTMDLNSVERSIKTTKTIIKVNERKDSMDLSDDSAEGESVATGSEISSIAESEKSVRFSVEIDQQEIKSEEERKKKIMELLERYQITQQEYDDKAAKNPDMLKMALLMYGKRTNHMERVMKCLLRLWRRDENLQAKQNQVKLPNPEMEVDDAARGNAETQPATVTQQTETVAAELGENN